MIYRLSIVLSLAGILGLLMAYCSWDNAKAMKACEVHHSKGVCFDTLR